MTDSYTDLQRKIAQQKAHIENLQRDNASLRAQIASQPMMKLGSNLSGGQGNVLHSPLERSSVFNSNWFYILHGAMVGAIFHLHLHHFDVVRDFYF